MKYFLRITAAALAVVLYVVVPARAGLPVQSDPLVEAEVDSLIRVAFDHAYDGRLDLGLLAVDRAQEIAPRDPRVGLTRFRLLRENYPVSVFEKERSREQEPALLAELEFAIAICDSMLEVDDRNPAAYLYRGWAYISKAQTALMARRLRAAAGASRSGKNDFDKFYEYYPQGDPDAATLMGVFLFYADTLPGFFKFIRWLVRVPGGDRERGLELLREAAAGDGYTSTDAKLMLAVTYYLFDGNLDDSMGMLRDAVERYPRHPWVVEYSCSVSFLFPELTGRSIDIQSELLRGWGETTVGWDDAVRSRLAWSLCRQYREIGDYVTAFDEMNAVVDRSPEAPYWVTPSVHLDAVVLAGHMGWAEEVDRLCERVPQEQRYDNLTGSFERACGWAADENDATAFEMLGRVRTMLYTGRVDEADDLLRKTVATHGGSIDVAYLEAEIARYRENLDDAVYMYRVVVSQAKEDGLDKQRVQALLRLGEIYIDRQDFESAKNAYEEAEEHEPGDTMFANFIRGRLRYIDRQKD